MPTTFTPDQSTVPDGAAVSILVDDDAVNMDDLYEEASPGGTKKLTLALLLSMVTSLWSKGGSAQIAAFSGTIWTIAAGNLSVFLHALADKAAKVDAFAQFTHASGVAVDNALQGGTVTSLGVMNGQGGVIVGNPSHTAAPLHIERGAYEWRDDDQISASATTANIDNTYPIWYADAWNGGGGSLVVTLVAPVTTASRAETEIVFVPTSSSSTLTLQYGGGPTVILVATGASSARLRWDGSKWRVISGGSTKTDATNFLVQYS